MEQADDLTLLPELSRPKRDAMALHVNTSSDFANINVEELIDGERTVFRGIGAGVLRKLHERAKLVVSPNPQPYVTAPLTLPHSEIEIFSMSRPTPCGTSATCMGCSNEPVETEARKGFTPSSLMISARKLSETHSPKRGLI